MFVLTRRRGLDMGEDHWPLDDDADRAEEEYFYTHNTGEE